MSTQWRRRWYVQAFELLMLAYAFLVGIRALGGGFKLIGHDLAQQFFEATANPFVGLAVGLLATTLVQSSSVTTSMVVALVAAPEDPLPIANAIPMVMGANIGTTVTNTVVSLGHISRKQEFRRAFAAATCHDFFNWIAVLVLLPLELMTGVLEKLSGKMASFVPAGVGGELPNPIKAAANLVLDPLEAFLVGALPKAAAAVVFVILAAGIIFGSLYAIVHKLRSLMAKRMEQYISGALDRRPITAMAVGGISTAMVQSSSITTSALVPLAGTGIVRLEQVFPIALGANVGTTLTALVAAMGAPEQTLHLAVQISLVHLLFNVAGILLVYPVEKIRNVPLRLSRWLAEVATRSKKAAFGYVLGLFYGVPALLVVAYRVF